MALVMKGPYKAELWAGRKVKATKQKLRKKDQPNQKDWVWEPRWQPHAAQQYV